MRTLAVFMIGALSSCTCGTISPEEFQRRYTYGEGRVYTRSGLAQIVDQLERRVGTSLRVTSISLLPGSASFSVQDPDKPQNFDTYTYSYFKWDKPRPISTSGSSTPETFALRDVPFDKIPDLVVHATSELAIEEGTVSGITVSGADGQIELDFSVRSPRQHGSVRFDAAGVLIDKRVY